MIFRQRRLFRKFGPPWTKFIRRKKEKKDGGQAWEWTYTTRVCAKFQGLSLKNGVDIKFGLFVRKTVIYVVASQLPNFSMGLTLGVEYKST